MTESRKRLIYAAVLVVAVLVLLYAFGVFTPSYTLTVQLDGQGSVTPAAGEYSHTSGEAIAFRATPSEGYEFAGWAATAGTFSAASNEQTDFTMPSEDTRVTARFTLKEYEVTFEDWDGEALDVQTVSHGSAASAPADPERDGYDFVGWDAEFDNITAPVTVTALYEIKEYEVTFEDWDGEVLDTQVVEYGSDASAPQEPEREGYDFVGWDTELEGISDDITVTAQYEIREYTVTFEDWDGTQLALQTVEHGSAAEAPEEPEREGYEFVEWDTRFDAVIDDVIVVAEYEILQYTVTFTDWTGEVIAEQTVDHGSAADAPAAPAREAYNFVGWNVEFGEVTSDLAVAPQYRIRTYAVIFEDWDGTFLGSQTVQHGDMALPPGDPQRFDHRFVGWDTDFGDVTSDLVIKAQYEPLVHRAIFQGASLLFGVAIQVYDDPAMDAGSRVGSPVTTGAAGMAAKELISGEYWFTAVRAGYEELQGSFTVAASDATVPFNLAPLPGTVSGTVLDESTSEGMQWAGLTLFAGESTASERFITATVTDADGLYRLQNVPPGSYTMLVRAHGYERVVEYPVQIRPGEEILGWDYSLARVVQEIDSITLEDFGSDWMSFLVVDVDGQPYDGTVPWALQLQERPGETLQDVPHNVSYDAVWDPNIDAQGRAVLTYRGLTVAVDSSVELQTVIETDDGAHSLEVVLRMNVIGDVQER